MKKWILIVISVIMLSGCGSAKETSADAPGLKEPKKEVPGDSSGPYWFIEVSDTKNFSYSIPSGGGKIDMTATLHFIAWKEGGEEMLGQYEGRALVALDMDLGEAGSGGVTYTGGVMEDTISDDISFELTSANEKEVTAKGEDIDIAPLAKFIGQAEIITDEYTISNQAWQALADGEVKLNVNGGFGDGAKNPQGFTLKAGEDSVLISVADLSAAYQVEAFLGTIQKYDIRSDGISWFRDKVMARMEERMALSEQSAGQQMPQTGGAGEGTGLTVDSEGREGMDTNGDGRLEIYFGEDGEVWADFDGDGKYEIAGSDGSSDMD